VQICGCANLQIRKCADASKTIAMGFKPIAIVLDVVLNINITLPPVAFVIINAVS